MQNRQPDKTTVAALVWMIAAGAVFLIVLTALLLRSGLDALGKNPLAVLILSCLLVIVIVIKLWARTS